MSNDNLLTKSFNIGYAMAKHDPALLKSLLKSANKESAYIKGLALGKAEYEKEALKTKLVEAGKNKNLEREK